ncbi:MAG: glycerol-3-phosphate dehydrogenase [Paracoccaceae bacterium]
MWRGLRRRFSILIAGEDSRFVVSNAQDAQARGADIQIGTKLVSAKREDELWSVMLKDLQTREMHKVHARMIVNAAGPWVGEVLDQKVHVASTEGVRLVRGSHSVTRGCLTMINVTSFRA